MKYKFLLTALVAVIFTSCSTYKAGQTPDDVYYSPVREVSQNNEKNKRDKYEDYTTRQDDRFLRMKIRNRTQWSTIDDYDYWYDTRYSHCNCNYQNTKFSGYNTWNSWNSTYYSLGCNPWQNNYYSYGYSGFYSPAFPIIFYKNPKYYLGNTNKSNLATYRNKTYNNTNYSGSSKTGGEGFGSYMRRVITNSNNGSNSSYDRPVRTFEPGSSTNSNAGGRSGGYDSKGSSSGSSSGSSGSSSSGGRAPRKQ